MRSRLAIFAACLLAAGCAGARTVRKEPPPRVEVAREAPAPARARAESLPEAPMDAPEGERQADDDFRRPLRRYTLVLAGAEARELFLSLARENDINLILSPEVSGSVTLDIKDATAPEIIDEACALLGCRAEATGRTVRVLPQKKTTRVFRVDYMLATRSGSGSLTASSSASSGSSGSGSGGGGGDSESSNAVSTEEKVDFWATLADEIQGFLSEGAPKPAVNKAAGTVTATDYPANLDRVAAYLRLLETRLRAGVLIEARILEITLDDRTQYGIDWSAAPGLSDFGLRGSLAGGNVAGQTLSDLGSAGATFQFGIAGNRFAAFLDALAQQGQIEVLSAPKISTLNNQKAIIRIGRQDVFFRAVVTPATTTSAATITYTPDSITEGIVLSVTPQISQEGSVMLAVHPSITAKVGDARAPDGNTAPILDVRETNTVVSVPDGQTVFIGGLMQTRTQEVMKSVPFLGDIPWLGSLFRNVDQQKKKTELVILITPRVVPPADLAEAAGEAIGSLRRSDRGHHAGGRPWVYGTEGETRSLRSWD